MIKITFCLRRRADFTLDAFQNYWLNKHAPLVASVKDALRIARYVQTHRMSTPLDDAVRTSRGAPEPYDGIAEIWWKTLEDLNAGFASKPGRDAGRLLLEDERRFIDLARSPLWFNTEHVIVT